LSGISACGPGFPVVPLVNFDLIDKLGVAFSPFDSLRCSTGRRVGEDLLKLKTVKVDYLGTREPGI
jgi:hypothetical protein